MNLFSIGKGHLEIVTNIEKKDYGLFLFESFHKSR